MSFSWTARDIFQDRQHICRKLKRVLQRSSKTNGKSKQQIIC